MEPSVCIHRCCVNDNIPWLWASALSTCHLDPNCSSQWDNPRQRAAFWEHVGTEQALGVVACLFNDIITHLPEGHELQQQQRKIYSRVWSREAIKTTLLHPKLGLTAWNSIRKSKLKRLKKGWANPCTGFMFGYATCAFGSQILDVTNI